jgi:alkylation response protein AidB-like acyl-CoA dehydrogenase
LAPQPDPNASAETIAAQFRAWMDAHRAELEPFRHEHPGDLGDSVTAFLPLQRMLFDDGWTKLGWPLAVGGLGGSATQRATVLEELAAAGYSIPEILGSVEIIAPMLIRWAPELAAANVADGVRGNEMWCQGFSEPDAGSDLGSLRTKATVDGDNFRITGQKMWSSSGHIAKRCCLLARTGEADSGYRGLTMFWVDIDSPGVTVRPTMCESGRHEVAELFFDDVVVPSSRIVGSVGNGWQVVMYLLQFERGAYAWKRQAELHTQLSELIAALPSDARETGANAVGNAYLSVFALRSQCSPTFATLNSGVDLGPGISIDKILLSTCEQTMTDCARSLLWPALEIDDSLLATMWSRRWTFSRITTIYGGAGEVQRDLVAERLLGLPRGR